MFFTIGYNNSGQLGVGKDQKTFLSTSIPQKLIGIPPIKQISCGDYFSFCLSEDGELYCFGLNTDGQLGLGNKTKYYNSPQKIPSLKDVKFVECGSTHTFCATLNNDIYCWGSNEHGKLGLENNNGNQYTPILCSSLVNEEIIDIKCAFDHTLALTSNGDVLSCGSNVNGQLGRKTEKDNSNSFQKIKELSEIIRIECGSYHSMCIDINNDLYVFGRNNEGQLGFGCTNEPFISQPTTHSLKNIIDIACGHERTFFKTYKNEIYVSRFGGYLELSEESPNVNYVSRVFEDNEDIWRSNDKPKSKSARSVFPNEDDDSPPLKKQRTE